MMIVAALLPMVFSFLISMGVEDGVTLPDTRAASAESTLESNVESIIRGLSGDFGVAVYSFKDGRTLAINADRPFETASLYKLLVAYQVYREVERGALSMDDPITIAPEDTISSDPGDDIEVGDELNVADALHAMITWSSNSAALALVRVSGGWESVLAGADELGFPVQTQDDQFHMRPVDLAAFYQRLVAGSLLSRPYSDDLIVLLLGQQKNDRIPAMLPEGTNVAHKTGELENIRNDAGVVFGPRSGYVIVVMANNANSDEAVQAEATISRLVYDSFEGHQTSPYY